MNQEQLKGVLEKHTAWRNGRPEGVRADLHGADLRHVDLHSVNLRRADLRGAILRGADLRSADLYCADLSGADLSYADLRSAHLSCADLRGAVLYCTDLRGTSLSGACLRSASLYCAHLHGANLSGAKLRGTIGDSEYVKSIQCFIYSITYTSEVLQIGCQQHPIQEWWSFTDERIHDMDGDKALKFWTEHKALIRSIVEASPAKATK